MALRHCGAMTGQTLHFTLPHPDATARLAKHLGRLLQQGDCVLLEGSIGAGKTHFARALIQSLLQVYEDVPSPTFTLVQTYDSTKGEIWHSDLYRLTQVDEVFELGLEDAFDTAITLIEWPDRLGDLAPPNALHLSFEPDPKHHDQRHLKLAWQDDKWTARLKDLKA